VRGLRNRVASLECTAALRANNSTGSIQNGNNSTCNSTGSIQNGNNSTGRLQSRNNSTGTSAEGGGPGPTAVRAASKTAATVLVPVLLLLVPVLKGGWYTGDGWCMAGSGYTRGVWRTRGSLCTLGDGHTSSRRGWHTREGWYTEGRFHTGGGGAPGAVGAPAATAVTATGGPGPPGRPGARGLVYQELTYQGLLHRGLAYQGLAYQGLVHWGLVHRELVFQGLVHQGQLVHWGQGVHQGQGIHQGAHQGAARRCLLGLCRSRHGRGPFFRWTLPGHKGQITALTVSADGVYLLSGSSDGSLRVWWGGQCRFSAGRYHEGSILSLAYGDEDTLFSCGEDKAVKAWGGVIRGTKMKAPTHSVTIREGALLSPLPVKLCCMDHSGGRKLVIAYSDGTVCLHSVPPGGAPQEEPELVIRDRGACHPFLDLAGSGSTVFSRAARTTQSPCTPWVRGHSACWATVPTSPPWLQDPKEYCIPVQKMGW